MSPFQHVDAFLSSLATLIPPEGHVARPVLLAAGHQCQMRTKHVPGKEPEGLWTSQPPASILAVWLSVVSQRDKRFSKAQGEKWGLCSGLKTRVKPGGGLCQSKCWDLMLLSNNSPLLLSR